MYHKPTFEPTRDEMMSILEQHIPFLNRTELVPLAEADGRVAAADISAPYSLPNRAASACDGIAVRFSDVAGKTPDTAAWVEGREYVYSNTGVAIPDMFDTVIPIEEVICRADGSIALRTLPQQRGEEVQPAGSQMQQGETLVCRGETLTPVTLGILLSAGIQSVNVYAAPRVLFLPTGDELVPSGGPVPPGKNVESNSLLISAMLRQFGCKPAVGGILPDSPTELETALLQGALQADLVIIGAGSSKGNKDFTMDVLENIGEVIVQEIGVAPGKHCSLTLVQGTPVLGIPGPPGGAQLICQYYVQAAVELLTTGKRQATPRVSATLTADLPGRWIDFMQPVHVFWEEGQLFAAPMSAFGKTRAANRRAFLQVLYCPKGRHFHAGEQVAVEFPLLRGPF